MTKVFLSLFILINVSFATNIATGFDYPMGNKGYVNGEKVPMDEHIKDWGNGYNVDRNEEYNLHKGIYANNNRGGNWSSDWYNISDIGNFLNLTYTFGLHPGEDWNKGSGTNDVGEAISAIANGIVKYIKTTYSGTTQYGWTIVLEHTLPDNSKIYSIYTHVTYDVNNNNGVIASNQSQFRYQVNQSINKGQIIARVASISGMSPHLHFEIRDKITSDLYPNDNGNGYYTHNKSKLNSMTQEQVVQAFGLMRQDGILDASDFIDDHRDIESNIGLSFFDGAGSVIDNSKDIFGGKYDVAQMHPHSINSTVVFQWRQEIGMTNCQKLNIFSERDIGDVIVRSKSWDARSIEDAFKVGLGTTPITLSNSNQWTTLAVTTTVPLTSKVLIYAQCTTNYNDGGRVAVSKDMVDVGLNYFWSGTGSIISRIDRRDFGTQYDYAVTNIDKASFTSFQWDTTNCKTVRINSGSFVSTSGADLTIDKKPWSSDEYSWNQVCDSVPCAISEDNEGYYILKIKSNSNAISGGKITVMCSD